MKREKFKNHQFYHVYNQGFEKMMIFKTNRDLEKFEYKMEYYSAKYKIFIKDYALMGNHFHLLLKQLQGESVSKFMQKLQQSFAMYSNIKYRRRGPLFNGRFKAKSVTDMEYYLEIQKYIANNPVKAKIRVGNNYSMVGFSPNLSSPFS